MSVPDEDQPETYLRFQTVAKNLDVTVSTIARWVRDGRLKSVELPEIRGKRIARSEYMRFINLMHGPTDKKKESA